MSQIHTQTFIHLKVRVCVRDACASSDKRVAAVISLGGCEFTSYGDSRGLEKAVPQSMERRGQAIWIHLWRRRRYVMSELQMCARKNRGERPRSY